MKIGNVKIEGKYVLAPIADITDVAYRVLCRRYGASLVFSEMVSINALIRNNKATLKLTKIAEEERPVAIQLFGTKLEYFAKAVKLLDSDIIDLNLGCPATNILKQGAGGALLIRPGKIKEIVETLVKNTDKPVTVKMRSGMKKVNAVEIARIAEEAGASAITLHPRLVVQGYSGKADWSLIKEVKENVSIPVIGNGDVVDRTSAEKMLKETKCDLVMIGRAAIGDPSIFSRLVNEKEKPSYEENIKLLFDYYELAKQYRVYNFDAFKRRAMDFTKSYPNSTRTRLKMAKLGTIEQIKEILV